MPENLENSALATGLEKVSLWGHKDLDITEQLNNSNTPKVLNKNYEISACVYLYLCVSVYIYQRLISN